MAKTPNHFVSAMLVFVMLITLSFNFTVGQIGVCYGRLGNNLLSPHDVVELYKRHNIRRMRTYDPDYVVLDALRGSGIELTVVITNQFIEPLACYQSAANDWVRNHVTNYPDVNYKYISIGNEVSPVDGPTSRFAPYVLPAIRNIYRAVCRAGLDARIKITTTVSMSVLRTSYPPEDGAFRDDVVGYLRPILSFTASTGAPFMVNIYPYFAYINDKVNIDLGYALLEDNHGIEINGVYYHNLFYAMVDAVYAAMDRIAASSLKTAGRGGYNYNVTTGRGGYNYNVTGGKPGGNKQEVKAGETGHPSAGGHSVNKPNAELRDGGNIANKYNAKTYNQNLIRVVKYGTPRNPGPIEAYIFALFNENEKPGDETERHFGLFYPNGQPKYNIDFN